VIGAEARDRGQIAAAYRAATARMEGLLDALVSELPLLRAPVGDIFPDLRGPVACRMAHAVWPFRDAFDHGFITPMAAVAGSVADELLAAMRTAAALDRAYVNNGGDIALHLTPGQSYRVGVVGDVAAPAIDATATISAEDGIAGLATSGWRGRSLSLGIADAVTVLAATAAKADAATKPIAAAITAEHAAIRRKPARELRDDSDLGELAVVVDVGPLPAAVIAQALDHGFAVACALHAEGRIRAAYLQLQGACRIITPNDFKPALQKATEDTPA